MLGKTEMLSEQEQSSLMALLTHCEEREILYFSELEKGNFKSKEQLRMQISVHLVQVQPFLLCEALDGVPAVCRPLSAQQGTLLRIAPDGRSQEHCKDCFGIAASLGSSHLT